MLLGNLFRVWLKTQVILKVGGFIAQYYGAGKTFLSILYELAEQSHIASNSLGLI
jgi:hypothetical protein